MAKLFSLPLALVLFMSLTGCDLLRPLNDIKPQNNQNNKQLTAADKFKQLYSWYYAYVEPREKFKTFRLSDNLSGYDNNNEVFNRRDVINLYNKYLPEKLDIIYNQIMANEAEAIKENKHAIYINPVDPADRDIVGQVAYEQQILEYVNQNDIEALVSCLLYKDFWTESSNISLPSELEAFIRDDFELIKSEIPSEYRSRVESMQVSFENRIDFKNKKLLNDISFRDKKIFISPYLVRAEFIRSFNKNAESLKRIIMRNGYILKKDGNLPEWLQPDRINKDYDATVREFRESFHKTNVQKLATVYLDQGQAPNEESCQCVSYNVPQNLDNNILCIIACQNP